MESKTKRNRETKLHPKNTQVFGGEEINRATPTTLERK
jgi:hypothetical protein